jgi:hypothetical protein
MIGGHGEDGERSSLEEDSHGPPEASSGRAQDDAHHVLRDARGEEGARGEGARGGHESVELALRAALPQEVASGEALARRRATWRACNARKSSADPEKYRALRRAAARRYKASHPGRIRARQVVADAVKLGKIVRPVACEECGKPGRVEFDHTNGYAPENALVGRFLCKKCHWDAENLRREEARRVR